MSLTLLLQGLAIGLVNGALYILTALGLTLIYGILHIVNFAHGEVFMLGAMLVYVVYVLWEWPLLAALPAIALTAAVVGWLVERGIFRRLRGQWLQLLVATVGVSLIIQSLSWLVFGAQEKNVPSILPGVLVAWGIRMPYERLAAAGIAMCMVAALYAVVYKTRSGLAMRAIEEDEETARMLGAMLVYVVYVLWEWPLLAALPAIALTAAIVGWLVERGIFRRLRGQSRVLWWRACSLAWFSPWVRFCWVRNLPMCWSLW